MIFGIGTDLVQVERIEATYRRFGAHFVERLLMPEERALFDPDRRAVRFLAMRFAAKEAISKALGTGIRGIRWREMEVVSNRRGKPIIVLHGTAAERAALLGITDFDISLTHSRTDAMAFVVGFRADIGPPLMEMETGER